MFSTEQYLLIPEILMSMLKSNNSKCEPAKVMSRILKFTASEAIIPQNNADAEILNGAPLTMRSQMKMVSEVMSRYSIKQHCSVSIAKIKQNSPDRRHVTLSTSLMNTVRKSGFKCEDLTLYLVHLWYFCVYAIELF
jgi:hypothetical protein